MQIIFLVMHTNRFCTSKYIKRFHKFGWLYIAQVKRKCGLELAENFNLPKSEDSRQPQCPKEKEEAIMEALSHFGMIETS